MYICKYIHTCPLDSRRCLAARRRSGSPSWRRAPRAAAPAWRPAPRSPPAPPAAAAAPSPRRSTPSWGGCSRTRAAPPAAARDRSSRSTAVSGPLKKWHICSFFSNETHESGSKRWKKLKIDPWSVSGACLGPLIDYTSVSRAAPPAAERDRSSRSTAVSCIYIYIYIYIYIIYIYIYIYIYIIYYIYIYIYIYIYHIYIYIYTYIYNIWYIYICIYMYTSPPTAARARSSRSTAVSWPLQAFCFSIHQHLAHKGHTQTRACNSARARRGLAPFKGRLLWGFCARINHPFIVPFHLHRQHYCNTTARLLRNTRAPPDPLLYAIHLSIGNGNVKRWVQEGITNSWTRQQFDFSIQPSLWHVWAYAVCKGSLTRAVL